jgi:hypothetical protein
MCRQRVYNVNVNEGAVYRVYRTCIAQRRTDCERFENVISKTPVVTVDAIDSDQGEYGRLTYSFSNDIEREATELFEINATSGSISLRTKPDYETRSQYILPITVSDHGQPQKVITHCTNYNLYVALLENCLRGVRLNNR